MAGRSSVRKATAMPASVRTTVMRWLRWIEMTIINTTTVTATATSGASRVSVWAVMGLPAPLEMPS